MVTGEVQETVVGKTRRKGPWPQPSPQVFIVPSLSPLWAPL